jgi:ABC-type transporter Mla subunit MlaD
MARRGVRNQVLAGGFVLLMLIAVFVVLVLVGGREAWFSDSQTLRIRFDEAPNLKIGNPVLLLGHPIGRVTDIAVVEAPCPPPFQDETCYVIEVACRVPARFVIREDARVVIQQSLVGQMAMINIEDSGRAEPVEGFLEGNQASPFAAAAGELGIGAEEKKGIQEMLKNLKDIAANVKTDLPETLAKLKETTTNLAEVSAKAKGTLERVDGILDENREDLRATIVHAKSLATKADAGVGEVVENVKTASADAKKTVADIREVVALHKGNLSKMAQNLRITSEHLKAVAEEVRRAPWRLFARPDKQKVESLNLYDSARAFATAASDLQAVTETLGVLCEAKAGGVEVDTELIQGMIERLQTTFDNYDQAQNALFEEFERIQE